MTDIKKILENAKTIAVAGLSPTRGKPSGGVADYLISKGYKIIPVNPVYEEILGQKSYPSLSAIPAEIKIDIVDVFRKSEDTPPVAREAVKRKPACLWLQLGIENDEARRIAEEAGIDFIQDKCIKVEHKRCCG